MDTPIDPKVKAKKLLGVIISSCPSHHLVWHLAPEETQKAEFALGNKYDNKGNFIGKEDLPDGMPPSRSYVPTLEDLESANPAAKARISNMVKKIEEAIAALK
jgi:hypothetical protein